MALSRLIIASCSLFMFINFSLSFAQPLSFSFNPSNHLSTNNILYEGAAAKPSSGVIELNAYSKDHFSVGRATYADPLHLWDSRSQADFTTNFSFVVDTLNDSRSGDGFAFFLAPVHFPIPPNSAGAHLGMFNTSTRSEPSMNQIVMVEFDTRSDKWVDPQGQHVGIDVNTLRSVVNASWNASSNSGKEGYVRISYNSTTHNFSVYWTYNESQNPVFAWNSSLSYPIDLRTVLPEWVTIGFSASTGFGLERHAINSWEFSSNLDSDERIVKWKKTTLIVVVVVSFSVLMIFVALCWFLVRKRMKRIRGNNYTNDGQKSMNTNLERLALPRRFTYQELFAATNGFANDTRLGHGGSGQVYKGFIQDVGGAVAVKRIFAQSEQYEKIFTNEVKIISRIIHRHLVQFIGWCHEQGECLLVYAYMPNSSLDEHLFGCRTSLLWDFRYKIALGLASALHYLHEDAEQCVLHRDIKSANVLLDNDFNTKLGDFGIAKLVDTRFRTQSTGVVGTFGYMAPEYANGGRASKESDMFSFGVVALELVCGRRTYEDGEYHLPLYRWVWQLYLVGNLLDVVDERLEMIFDRNEMECLLMVGLWCTHPKSKERPKAGQVMKVLRLEAPLPELATDMYDHHALPQLQQHAGSSQVSLTSSFDTVGR